MVMLSQDTVGIIPRIARRPLRGRFSFAKLTTMLSGRPLSCPEQSPVRLPSSAVAPFCFLSSSWAHSMAGDCRCSMCTAFRNGPVRADGTRFATLSLLQHSAQLAAITLPEGTPHDVEPVLLWTDDAMAPVHIRYFFRCRTCHRAFRQPLPEEEPLSGIHYAWVLVSSQQNSLDNTLVQCEVCTLLEHLRLTWVDASSGEWGAGSTIELARALWDLLGRPM